MPAADVEAVPGDAVVGGLFGVVEAAEEERGIGDVCEGFGPVIQLRRRYSSGPGRRPSRAATARPRA
jgi:hypothetical protein